MPKFLIDENLPSLLSDYLRELKYESSSVREVGLRGKSDLDIIKWIQKNKRVLITGDSDFGEFFYFRTLGKMGVIILKSKFQKLNAFKEIIGYLHKEGVLQNNKLEDSLVVAIRGNYRVRRYLD